MKPHLRLARRRLMGGMLPAILLFSTVAATRAAEAPAPAIVVRLATVAPERSGWLKTFREAAAEATAATGGRVQFKLYPGGVQGDEQTVLRKMRVGQLQAAAFLGQGVRLFCPDATVLQLPLMFRSEEEFTQGLQELDATLREEARKNHMEILAWTRQGFAYLYSRKPVADLDALRKAKPWLVPDDGFSETLFRAAGVTGITIPTSDVLTGLQSGLLDTVYAPPLAMIVLQWHTRVSYKLDIGLAYSTGAVVVTSAAWDQIGAADRAQLQAVFSKRIDELNAQVHKQNEESDAVMAKQVQVLKPSEATVNEFRKLSDTVVAQLTGQAFSEAILKQLQASLARQREKK